MILGRFRGKVTLSGEAAFAVSGYLFLVCGFSFVVSRFLFLVSCNLFCGSARTSNQ
jgi:hypothetical protein